MSIEILLPALSPTMENGKIKQWHKQVGDKVKSGDVLFEVETDKAVMEVEATDNGILAHIELNKDTIPIGTLVAVIAEKNEDVAEVSQRFSMLKSKNINNQNVINQNKHNASQQHDSNKHHTSQQRDSNKHHASQQRDSNKHHASQQSGSFNNTNNLNDQYVHKNKSENLIESKNNKLSYVNNNNNKIISSDQVNYNSNAHKKFNNTSDGSILQTSNVLTNNNEDNVRNFVQSSYQENHIQMKKGNLLHDNSDTQNIATQIRETISDKQNILKSTLISPRAKINAMIKNLSKSDTMNIVGSGEKGRIVSRDIKKYVQENNFSVNSSDNLEHLSNLSHQSTNNHENENMNTHQENNNHSSLTTSREGIELKHISHNPSHNNINPSHNNTVEKPSPLSGKDEFRISISTQEERIPTTIEPSHMRKAISVSLVKAIQTIPTFLIQFDCIADNAIEFIQVSRNITGIKISLNDLIVKACSFAIFQNPKFNTLWNDNKIISYNTIDIGIAISVNDGVVVRNIKNAYKKTITEISIDTKKMSQESKESIIHEPYVFATSNMGIYNIETFAATLSGTAILAIGTNQKKPIVENDQIVIKNVIQFTLTCDHRIVDGADAAKWVKVFRMALSNPYIMLL